MNVSEWLEANRATWKTRIPLTDIRYRGFGKEWKLEPCPTLYGYMHGVGIRGILTYLWSRSEHRKLKEIEPTVKALLQIDGVQSVHFKDHSVIIQKEPNANWEEIKGEINLILAPYL